MTKFFNILLRLVLEPVLALALVLEPVLVLALALALALVLALDHRQMELELVEVVELEFQLESGLEPDVHRAK